MKLISNLLKPTYRNRNFLILSIIAYLISINIVHNDPHFTYRWLAFFFNMLSLGIIFFLYVSQTATKNHFKKLFSEKEINPIIVILTITIVANFLLLSIYPYVSISDELRDGGMFAMKIASGVLKNIFGYGSYDAHGLIIPTLAVPFYYLFGNSTLAFRFPAALLATGDVLLLYILVRLVVNRSAAFWSALVLATLPLHMFFAHTQIVIAFNLFWVPVLLLALWHLLKRHRNMDYIFFGTLLGFVCGFHAAIRVFACVTFFVFVFLEFREMIKQKLIIEEGFVTFFTRVLLVLCFAVIGFGPRLLFTGPQDFFHTSRFIFESNMQANQALTLYNFATLKANYLRSLMVYFYEPTSFFYPVDKPILPPFLAIFFFVGLGYAAFVLRKTFLTITLSLLIILPFFTSAITDWINADHRASPLFAIASVFVGVGISYILSIIKNNTWRNIATAWILLYLGTQVLTFYTLQPANEKWKMRDYLSMHIIYFLQHDKKYQASPAEGLHYLQYPATRTPACVFVSPANYDYLSNNFGILEQQYFLLPKAIIQFAVNPEMYNNSATVVPGQCPDTVPSNKNMHVYTISCTENRSVCPLGDNGNIVLHY